MELTDIRFLVSENYIAFLILGGLLVIMYAYREVSLPASKTFRLIAFALFVMCIFDIVERWAASSYDRLNIRVFASVVHYIVQPLIIYLELAVLVPHKHSNKLSSIIHSFPIFINSLIYLVAPFTGELVFWYDSDYDFHRGPLGISIYVVTFIYLALLIYWAFKSFHVNNQRLSTVLLFMAAIAILTGGLEAFNIVSGFIDEAFAFGVFLFYMYLITVHERQIREELVEKELEISQQELALLRHQIRPHFVFNTLSIIKSLIRSNPPKAIECLEDFSDYLRANLDILTSEGLVPFDEELGNIQAYVSLAMADETKDVNVKYDINEHHFRLPPLSIEPFVENAIKHGLTNGGTIVVSTTSDDNSFIVTISDDGPGYKLNETKEAKKRKGIGIDNSRIRLAKQCNGTLDIKSDSSGTVVTVRIPKNNAELGESV